MITNQQLLKSENHDAYCVSCRPPEIFRDKIRIQVRDEDPAIAIANPKEKPYTVNSIREGKLQHLWLLSSGILLFDERMQLAMGKRNHKSSDPGLWTHIGAGRCDDKIINHALRELAEEFHCYSNLDNEELPLRLLPDIIREKEWLPFILMQAAIQYKDYNWVPFEWKSLPELVGTHLPGCKSVEIIWPDDTEELEAFVFLDEMNRTIEIRLVARIDLENYPDNQLLFPEGEQIAEWLPLDTLIYLRHKEKKDQLHFFVPFMQFFLDSLSHAYSRSGNHYNII